MGAANLAPKGADPITVTEKGKRGANDERGGAGADQRPLKERGLGQERLETND
jgi:hypothetical protein